MNQACERASGRAGGNFGLFLNPRRLRSSHVASQRDHCVIERQKVKSWGRVMGSCGHSDRTSCDHNAKGQVKSHTQTCFNKRASVWILLGRHGGLEQTKIGTHVLGSSVCSFARTTHSFTCTAMLALLAHFACSFGRLLDHSIPSSCERDLCL